MVFYILSLVLGVASLVTFLVMRVKKMQPQATVAKAVTSVFFMATAAACSAMNPTPFASLVIIGLLCGLLGDIWLDLKYVYPQHDTFYTYCGFSSFMASHFFFVPAICISAKFKLFQVIIGIACALVVGVLVLVMEKPLKMEYGKFKSITFVYSCCLALSVALSVIYMIISGFAPRAICLAVGTALVLLSDLVLSGTYFGEGKDRPVDVILNHALYYAGQFVAASAILFVA